MTGFLLRNKDGDPLLSSGKTTWSLLDVFEVPGGGSEAHDLPALAFVSEAVAQVSFVSRPAITQKALQHTAVVNLVSATVSVNGGNRACRIIILGR